VVIRSCIVMIVDRGEVLLSVIAPGALVGDDCSHASSILLVAGWTNQSVATMPLLYC